MTPPAGESLRTPAAAERPDYLPDVAWDSEAKAPRADFIKTAFDTHAAHEARLAARPEKPDGYKLELPKDFKTETPVKINEKDPALAELRALAHEENWSQERFSSALAIEARRVERSAKQYNDWVAEQPKKLGANGEARVTAMKTWTTGLLGEQGTKLLFEEIQSGEGMQLLEKMMTAFVSGGGSQYRNGGQEPPVVVAPPVRREDKLYPDLARKAS